MAPVRDVFRTVFEKHGYGVVPSSPIFPCPDESTLFTCATISVFKPQVLSGEVRRVLVEQPCLRTQNLKRALDCKYDPEYLSSFLMFGMLCPVHEFELVCVSDFFGRFSELNGRILIRSSQKNAHDLFRSVESLYPVERDTRHQQYYVWGYGEKRLLGQGLTFALRQPDGEHLDIGNLVVISCSGVPIAIEFGFGEETFLARLQGLKTPYAASSKYLSLGLGMTPVEKKIGDALITAQEIFACGVRPGAGKAASVLRKALRLACFLTIRQYGESAAIRIRELAQCLSVNPEWLIGITNVLGQVIQNVSAFEIAAGHIRKHATGLHLEKKIEGYRQRYGIPEGFP